MPMVEFRVTKVWMEHSGGTKFYQVFKVQDTVNPRRVATIGHYGPMNVARGKGSRPINGGQTIVKPNDSYSSLVSAKARRGYQATAKNEEETFRSDAAIKEYLEKYFSAGDRHVIEESIGLHGERVIVPSGPADTEPVEEDTTPRPDGWGDW